VRFIVSNICQFTHPIHAQLARASSHLTFPNIPSVFSTQMLIGIAGVNAQATDRNTLVFRLQLTCERKKGAKPSSEHPSPDELYINHELKSGHLQWVPQGEQAEVFADRPPAPTNPNIVLAKLRPGQEVDMELHAVKSVGKDHAKFSPVGT
jgi:DNA-directed RNA polymerase alpha subunit